MKNRSLEEIKDLLIVVDMVNGFIREGLMADKDIERIIPGHLELFEEFLGEGKGIAFIKDTHQRNSSEFERYPMHCVEGTSEAELVDEFKPYEKKALVYEKNSTSAIYAPRFIDDINKMKRLREIVITGCCTDICVMNLAIPLQNYFDQIDRKVNIVVPTDLVETYNSDTHKRDEYNEMAFKLMRNTGIQLVKKYNGGKTYGK